jgi:hypothetical protein
MPDEPPMPDSPKCGRCSGPILDGELVLRDRREWLHVRCARIIASNDRVRESRVLGGKSHELIEGGKQRLEESRGLRLLEIVERVAAVAQQQACCFPCLAEQLRVVEPHVRSAAQILVVRGSFKRARRVCHSCGRTDDLLVLRNPA